MSQQPKLRILCVSASGSRLKRLWSSLSSGKYEALAADTPEQAVAFCVGNNVAAVVLDSEFTTTHGWSAAQTFKSINPHLLVLLLHSGHNGETPAGIDAVAPTIAAMLDKLNLLLTQSS